jgi:hypothetical protein
MRPFLFSRGAKHYARFIFPTPLQNALGRKSITYALGEGSRNEIALKVAMLALSLEQATKETAVSGSKKDFDPNAFDWGNVSKFEINIERGIYKADPGEDTQNMLAALRELKTLGALTPRPSTPARQHLARQTQTPAPSP